MASWQRRLLGLGMPYLLPWTLDLILTASGQPSEYWAGDYSRTTEGGAFYRLLYEINPVVGISGHFIYLFLVLALLVLLPQRFAVMLALAAAFGSTWGASTWVQRYLITKAAWGAPTIISWYQATNFMFVITSMTAGTGIYWFLKSTVNNQENATTKRQWILMGVLLTCLGAIILAPWTRS